MEHDTARGSALELRVPPLLVVLVVALGMWLVARIGPRLPLAPAVRNALAIVLLIAGFGVIVAGVVAFRRASTTVNPMQPDQVSSMVTGGIYRLTRNPMYLGMLLALAAWAAWLASVLALAGLPLFVLYLNRFQIAAEERTLARRFGVEYSRYAQHTRRWL